MKTIADACMILGWLFYSVLMRLFWIPMTLWFVCLVAIPIWSLNFDRIASYAVEHWGAREIDVMGERAVAILWDDPEEGKEPVEIFVHSLGANVHAPNKQMRLSPDDPLTVFVCMFFPFGIWLYLAFFTVGETIVRKKKRLIPGLAGFFSLLLPWTIPRYFVKHKRRFWFPFRISQKRDTTAKRRIGLLIFYVFCGIAATAFAFRAPYPSSALFSVWFLGGIGLIVYAVMFHCIALCVCRRKNKNCRLESYTCATQHVCIGGLVYPWFPFLTSFAVYGFTSPALLWTVFWLMLAVVCVPLTAAGYTATAVTIGVWFASRIKKSLKWRWYSTGT